jgi:hypothetical protein
MCKIKRTIIETVRQEVTCTMKYFCCERMKSGLKADYGPKMWGEHLQIANAQIMFCPWCGEKVMYDDHVTLPEGYKKA